MRKIIAGVSLLTAVLLMGHTGVQAVRMFSRGSVQIPAGVVSWAMFGLMIFHALISLQKSSSRKESAWINWLEK